MGAHDLKIINGRLVLAQSVEPGVLLIDDGRITAILRPGRATQESANQVIDAKGRLVLPGLVDVHVHFRDPGYPNKEDFASGSNAAAAGGVTTIADMPNTNPPTTTAQRLADKVKRANEKCIVDFTFHGGPYRLEDQAGKKETLMETKELALIDAAKEMCQEGIISFKIYMPHLEAPSIPHLVPLGLPLSIHAEDPQSLLQPKDGSSFAFLASRPPEAEVSAIEQLLRNPVDTSFHICHVSTAAGLRQILEAQNRQLDVTSEVTPHHLLLNVKDLAERGPVAKCYPPLRSRSDNQALLNACLVGQVDIIASDHAPHTDEEKAGPGADFDTAPAGIIGVETALPLMYTYLVVKNELPLPNLIQMMALNPAQRFCIRNKQTVDKGQITVGADADLVIFDHKTQYKIRGDHLHGKSNLTPFEGWKVTGKVYQTMLRGATIFEQED